ncbi:Os05g0235450, partial [Oryza sativa Japonica Group]
CCFPVNLATHVCERSCKHAEGGTAISWDDALQLGMRSFDQSSIICSPAIATHFVANCLNRLAYNGSVKWNVLNVAALVWLHGQWVDKMPVVRSFFPFLTVTRVGILMAGWLS